MTKSILIRSLALLSIPLAFATSLLAHHSFAAEFDKDKPVKVTGMITKVEWTNPHIWIYLDVKNSDGTVTSWAFEGPPPGPIMRYGVTKDQLNIGDTIVIEGSRTKDGSTHGNGSKITFPDGRSVLFGPAQNAAYGANSKQ